MSDKKSAARARAEKLITDFKLRDGIFSNVFSSSTGPAEDHSPAPVKSTKNQSPYHGEK